jgi:hypothetical protein
MTLKRLTLLLFLFAVLLMGGCKKYPDGPEFSLLPKSWRLAGDWKTTKILENNIDVTARELATVNYESRKIDKNGSFSYELVEGGSTLSYAGSWSFSSDKTIVYFTYAFASTGSTDQFLILRLKEKDLWLQNISPTGDVMEYHFSPN